MTEHDNDLSSSPTGRRQIDYGALTIVNALPRGSYCPKGGEETLARLRGATICDIGSPADDGIEGGGVVIDYIPRDAVMRWRAVLAFTEEGMWVEHDAPLDGFVT